MPIDLGLYRISRLLKIIGNPHIRTYQAIHVAGTNGKGSTIAYISSILTQAHIRNGRFTSPHLLESNDCIAINNETYPKTKFDEIKSLVNSHNDRLELGCTEFELLTATAFKIFEIEKVELAIIEVGLGGRLDATNVLVPPMIDRGTRCTGLILGGITKIGMDHENFLGNTLSDIAKEKAGIIKNEMIIFVDGSNEEIVLDALREKAKDEHASLSVVNANELAVQQAIKDSPLQGEYQIYNLAVALSIVNCLKDKFSYERINEENIKKGIIKTSWPGRLQYVTDKRTGISGLIDGAHNENAASELGKYLRTYRSDEGKGGLVFVVALSQGKSISNLLKHITIKSRDTLLTTGFTQPTDMPWVHCYLEQELAKEALEFVNDVRETNANSIQEVFDQLLEIRKKGDSRPIVLCGSLYLCSDILRYIRATGENAN